MFIDQQQYFNNVDIITTGFHVVLSVFFQTIVSISIAFSFFFFPDRQNYQNDRLQRIDRVNGWLDHFVGGLDLGSRPVLFLREQIAGGTHATNLGSTLAYQEPVGLLVRVVGNGLIGPEKYVISDLSGS